MITITTAQLLIIIFLIILLTGIAYIDGKKSVLKEQPAYGEIIFHEGEMYIKISPEKIEDLSNQRNVNFNVRKTRK